METVPSPAKLIFCIQIGGAALLQSRSEERERGCAQLSSEVLFSTVLCFFLEELYAYLRLLGGQKLFLLAPQLHMPQAQTREALPEG